MIDDEDQHDSFAGFDGLDAPTRARMEAAAVREVERLVEILDGGAGTDEDLIELAQRLRDAGAVDDAENVIHCNQHLFEDQELLLDLLEMWAQEELGVAVKAFQDQFALELTRIGRNGPLDFNYRSLGGPPRRDEFELLAHRCDIQIGCLGRGLIEANISRRDPSRASTEGLEGDACVFLTFVNGEWQVARPFEE